MKNITRSLFISIISSNIAYAVPLVSNEVNYTQKQSSTLKKVIQKFTFNYFAQYTGRSLSGNYQNGATYNRFAGGRDVNTNERLSTTSSEQIFQSFSLGHKLPQGMILSYGVTYQDNVKKNIKYDLQGGGEGERNYGRSYNDHRISLWIPNLLSFKRASLSSNFFYQLPTSEGSIENKMEYALGIQPTLAIYSSVPGLFHGFTASIDKGFFKKSYYSTKKTNYTFYKYNPDGSPWINPDGSPMTFQDSYNQTQTLQGVRANLGAYLNYAISKNITFKSSIQFDWDQTGKQVGTFNEWGNNLDNVGNLGASYFVRNGVSLEAGLNFSLEQASLDKTALFGSLSLTI